MTYYTEEDIMRSRIRYNLGRLSPEEISYCKREALKLYDKGFTDEYGKAISYDSWLDCIAEETVRTNEIHQAARCAEMMDL